MQGPRSVPLRDHLANTSCVRVTQDGTGADAKVPGDSVDERAADAADRGRSRTTDDPELEATQLEDTQLEDKEPTAPLPARVAVATMAGNLDEPRSRFLTLQTGLQGLGIPLLPPAAPPAAPPAEPIASPPPTAELHARSVVTAEDEQLQRLARLTEGGDLPKLHEHNWGGQERFAGSRLWLGDHRLELVRDKELPQSAHYKETMQWMRDVITCFSDLGYYFDIGLTADPHARLKGKDYGNRNRVDQCMYGLVKTDGPELARQIEKILQAFAEEHSLKGFANHLKAAGTGRSKEGPQTIYLDYWKEERDPPESQYDSEPPDTDSDGEEEESAVVPYYERK